MNFISVKTGERNMNKQDYIKAGGKVWQKETHERVYLSAEVFNKIVGTNYSDRNNKFYYDCRTNKLMRAYKHKKIEVKNV